MNLYQSLLDKIFNAGRDFYDSYKKISPLIEINSERVLFCGMGGSGISANYIANLSNISNKEIMIVKDYEVPKLKKTDLVIVSSYSGNTEETIEMARIANNAGCHLVMISSGGIIQELSIKWEVKHILVKSGLQPRFALPFMLGTLYGLVEKVLNLNPINDNLGKKIIMQSEILRNEKFEEEMMIIANSLIGSKIVILSDRNYFEIGLRFRCQLNENSKLYANNWVLPEYNHNGIVSLDGQKSDEHVFILIYDDNSHTRRKLHFEYFNTHLKNKTRGVHRINSSFTTPLENILLMTWKVDIISILAAKSQNIDPIKVEAIDKLKIFLKETIS